MSFSMEQRLIYIVYKKEMFTIEAVIDKMRSVNEEPPKRLIRISTV